ncbi:glycosyltransferase [Patescibacteria group bacterium]
MTDNKIKIVYLIDSFSLGGAEKFLLDLCQKIDKNKFEVHVAAVVFAGPLLKEFEKLDIQIKVFNKKTKLGLGLLWQLYKYLKHTKPQIVHTNLFGADTWGRVAALLARVPLIVLTEHNINLDEPKFKKLIKLVLSKFTTKIVAVSQGVKEYTVQTEKINKEKIQTIYYGIDLNKYQFRGYQAIDQQKTINAVCVGRLEEQKGHQYLIAALPLILKNYPSFKLHLIGAGSLADKINRQVKDLNLTDNVKFYGQRMDVSELLPQMDLFILPSIWEGLGIVLLEAQAVGLPVLASNIPAVNEVVKHEQTGLLFEPKNSQAIYEQVKHLIADQKLAENLVNKASLQIKNDFGLDTMVQNYANLYLDLINKTK